MREMKDSGVEWIGEIPAEWKTIRFWQGIVRLGTGLNPRDNFELSKEDDFYYVTIKSFKNGKLYLDDSCDRIDKKAWNIIQERSDLQKSDILFASISKDGQAYILESSPENWNINESVFCIRVNQKLFFPNFFYYLITNPAYYNDLRLDATGTTFQSIKQNKLRKSILVMPGIMQQHKIANYLDDKCTKIDAIIAKQEKIIEKIKLYKSSLIMELVLGGLHADIHMKDSGYDFIGAVPSTWSVMRLRNIGTPQNGISKGGEFFGQGFPFVSYGDVYRNFTLPKSVPGLVDSTEEEREKYSVREGDIFFTRTSETIEEVGFSCVCEKTIADATFAGFLIRVRPKNDILYTGYAKYYFRSNHLREYLVKEMNLVTRASLGQDLLKSMPVLIPPKEEQIEIANYLDQKCERIEKQVACREPLISKLTEYKKSLVYECVTGKKEII